MRIKALKLVYGLFLVAIVLRLFYWQIVRSDDLSAKAEEQHISTKVVVAPRGNIYSSDGSLMATNKPIFELYGLPKVIDNKSDVAEKLATVLTQISLKDQIDIKDPNYKDHYMVKFLNLKDQILSELSQDLYWVSLYHGLDFEEKAQIEELKIDGLGFDMGSTRYYPEGSSAAHLLGFVANNAADKPTGYFGIEGYYDKELSGKNGEYSEELDARGVPILTGKFTDKEPENGHNLILNLDRSVQYIVEKNLKAGLIKYQAQAAEALVMDPSSGAILAMAAYPNYDPNNFTNFPKENFINPVVAQVYEPGSTFKTIMMSAGVNEGLVTPDTQCNICAGPVEASGFLIKTWNNQYHPNTTMTDVFTNSDNTGMVFVGRKLGFDKEYQYLENYGIGKMTGVDLQDETSPALRAKKDWYDIDMATAMFGQGVAVTPLQLVTAFSAIANGGYLMLPQVVKSIQDGDKIISIKPKIVSHPITEETSKTITQMLVDAVSRGEVHTYVPKGYKVAAKSGTAQIPIAGHYDANKTIASYMGFAPAINPKFVILIIYQNPQTSAFGNTTAAPTFYDITKQLLTYYNIPPSE